MKDKIYEPARHNEAAPAPGMAAVNTHMPEETPESEQTSLVPDSAERTDESESGTTGDQ